MTEVLARAESDYDYDDVVDATRRFLPVRAKRPRWIGLLAAGYCGIVFSIGMPDTVEWPVFGLLVVAAAFTALALFARLQSATALRRVLREHAAVLPARCTVELSVDHVRVQQPELDLRLRWPDVRAVREVGDDIEVLHPRYSCVVRGRAFVTPDARARFLAVAAELFERSRSTA